MTHSFPRSDPDTDELAAIERAREHLRKLGHVWDESEPLVLWYSGDGRVWAGHRRVSILCTACDRTADYGEHDANAPEEGMYYAINPKWEPDEGGGRCYTAGGCYKLGEPCPGKPTFCNHNGKCPFGSVD